jgi:hypothetical protein
VTERERLKRGAYQLWLLSNLTAVALFAPHLLASPNWFSNALAIFGIVLLGLYAVLYSIGWWHERHCPDHPERDFPGPVAWGKRTANDLTPAVRWTRNTWHNIGGW